MNNISTNCGNNFLESRQPEVTKNQQYIFSPKGIQEGITSWTINFPTWIPDCDYCSPTSSFGFIYFF